MDIFNIIGSIFGYILYAAFYLFQNFGVAIIIFTLIIKLLLFPFSVKQQKSMASNARVQKKQREIMEKYGNDRVKANEEVQKMMEKENVSMTAGCLPMIAPMLVMLGVYYSVIRPLSNTLHIAGDKVNVALNSISTLPGIGSSVNMQYGEINIVKYFNELQPYIKNQDGTPLFNGQETQTIQNFSNGFNFFGWDLLAAPNVSSFQSLMWLIPVLCFVTSVASMIVVQKLNGTQMKGCMAAMIFVMPLFSAWIAFNVPGAVGFYWIASTVLGFVQSLILNIFFSPSILEAKSEVQRVLLRKNQEAEYAFIEAPDFVYPSQQGKKTDGENIQKTGKKKNNKSKNKKGNSSSNYQGQKK